MTPRDIEQFNKCLADVFYVLDGPPTNCVVLGSEKHSYVTFAVAGESADNSTLLAALWGEMKKQFPSNRTVLFWRTRPKIDTWEVINFCGDGPVGEEVQDGAEIPPGNLWDFTTGRYRQVASRTMMRGIFCRVWWLGVGGNKAEGEATPLLGA